MSAAHSRPAPKTRVLVVEQDGAERARLATVINATSDLCVAGEAGTIDAAKHLLPRGDYGVILVGCLANLPEQQVVDALRSDGSTLPMLIRGSFASQQALIALLGGGAQGVIPKESDGPTVSAALRLVANQDTERSVAAVAAAVRQ